MNSKNAVLMLALALVGAGVAALQAQEAPRPGDAGRTEDGVVFRAPEAPPRKQIEPEPLRVEVIEVHELAEGTHAGQAGDILLTFSGSGFATTSRNPVVRLAEGEMVLDDTLTDLAGRTLYVIVSREAASKVERLRFSDLTIVNPGGHEEGEFGQIRVEASPEKLLRPEAGAAKARLVYRDGEFVRVSVEG